MAFEKTSVRISGTALAAAALAGCTSAVVIESEFPAPLVDTLPVSVALYYDPELRDFIHAEALPRSSTWTIDLGDANVAMLDPLFGTMFASTSEIQTFPAEFQTANVDAVLASTLEEFQFDVPRSSRDEFVEVWLQYKLALQKLDGTMIIEWSATGYGKAEIDGDREEAVRRASVVAMREAGAVIATRFAEQQPVVDWVEEVQNARI